SHGPDLEAVDGETVIEARRAETGEQRVAETLCTPEHYRLDDGAPLPAQSERGIGDEPALQPVADAADAAAVSDDAPLLHPQDDVYALAAQPGRLVEAVQRSARLCQYIDD